MGEEQPAVGESEELLSWDPTRQENPTRDEEPDAESEDSSPSLTASWIPLAGGCKANPGNRSDYPPQPSRKEERHRRLTASSSGRVGPKTLLDPEEDEEQTGKEPSTDLGGGDEAGEAN